MMQSLKYGLVTTVGYMILLAALFALTALIEESGTTHTYEFLSPVNIVLMAIGGIIAFLAGFFFPRIFSRMVADYKSEYPDVPERYVVQICRGKLLQRYSYNLAMGCFLAGTIAWVGKWYLISLGIIFGIAYLRYKRKYQAL